MKIHKHIEIVCSTEVTLSSMSLPSRLAILEVLSKHYDRVGITIVNNLSDLKALVALGPDLVFLGVKFIPANPALGWHDPNKIWISDYLDAHDIAYTGSSQMAHQLELNKDEAKARVHQAGLSTSPFYIARQSHTLTSENIALTYPLFVKPSNRGGGLGIDGLSVVNNFNQLKTKVRAIAEDMHSDSLVEQYLPGREYSVAILKKESSPGYSVMPIELVANQNAGGMRILCRETKESNEEVVLEVLDTAVRHSVGTLALDVFHALGARDYCRIDIRIDENGNPNFLEANLIPSLISGYGSFPKACILNIGLGYENMILKITRLGLMRNRDTDFAESIHQPELSLNQVSVGLKTMFGTHPI